MTQIIQKIKGKLFLDKNEKRQSLKESHEINKIYLTSSFLS